MTDKLFFGEVERQGKAAVAEYMRRRGGHAVEKKTSKDLRKETEASPASGGQVFQSGSKNIVGGKY